jgi:hypothetical protein
MTREEYVKALRTERSHAETLTPEQGRDRRLSDIDAELSRFEPQPEPTGRRSGRAPETA